MRASRDSETGSSVSLTSSISNAQTHTHEIGTTTLHSLRFDAPDNSIDIFVTCSTFTHGNENEHPLRSVPDDFLKVGLDT